MRGAYQTISAMMALIVSVAGYAQQKGVDGGRCSWSTGLGRSEDRTSRVDRSWRCKCHHGSHQFLSTASHQGTGARSFLRFLAITRTVTAQEARLRLCLDGASTCT